MRLISLHINNYGKFSNFDYEFKNFSEICEDNGYGKSTLASFIKAMFYGLETIKSTTKFNDRKHYYPFAGGRFGGNLVFEFSGFTYRLERDFDEKSYVKDSLLVYKNNSVTDELGDIPGLAIFGINKESFERLISIDSEKINIETDSDINKKLNNYVENVSEDFDIDKVIKSIREKKKEKREKVLYLKDKIKNLKIEIANFQQIKNNLDFKYEKLNTLKKEKDDSLTEYEKASREETVLEKWKNYESIINDVNDKSKEIDKIRQFYLKGIPEESEIADIESLKLKINGWKTALNDGNVSVLSVNEYERLNVKYKNHMPNSKEIQSIENLITEYEETEKKIQKLTVSDKSERKKELDKHFLGVLPNNNDSATIENKLSKLEEEVNKCKKTTVTDKTLFIVSAILLAIGFCFLFIVKTVGFFFLAFGASVLIVALFMYYYSKLNTEHKNKLLNLFAKYRYTGEDLGVLMYQFKNDIYEYEQLILLEEEKQNQLRTEQEILISIRSKLDDYFLLFDLNNVAYRKAIEEIKTDLVKLITLKNTVELAEKVRKDLVVNIDKAISEIKNFYFKYSISDLKRIEDIKKDCDEIKRLTIEVKEKTDKALKFKFDNGLDKKPEYEGLDLEFLRIEMDRKNSDYNYLKQEIENLEDKISDLDEKKSLLEKSEEEKFKYDTDLRLYDCLIEEIGKADQVLKDKYVAPIKDKFVFYANLLEKVVGEKVVMDKNYKVYFDRNGVLRSSEHLSGGNLSICSLCFRLALLDNMFEKEKPFIIMDDPFLSLDSNHLKKVMDLIKSLSSDMQILYFCCHESRSFYYGLTV